MTPDEIAALKEAFSESLAPLREELEKMNKALKEHGDLLRTTHSRLTNVEGVVLGVERMVRKKAG